MKLKSLKRCLKTLNKENFSNIQHRVNEVYLLLQDAQTQALNQPTELSFQLERDLHQKWDFLSRIEEEYFRQRSRINWLQCGDQNTTYFNRMAEMRNSFNAVRYFSLEDGTFISDPNEMSYLAIRFFQSILAPDVMAPWNVS